MKKKKHGALPIALFSIFLSLYLIPSIVSAGGNPSTQLYVPAGQNRDSAFGDYVSATAANGGLQSYYSYFIEVTPGLGRLQIDIFDADIGFGDNLNGPRDRQRGGSWNTTASYTLYDPTGAIRPTRFTTGNAAGPAGSDNAWLMFYSGNGNYVLDNFTTVAYSNNNGNMNWVANWVENDSNGPAQSSTVGNILITAGGELRIHGQTGNSSIYREVDLSPTGLNLTSAFLSLSFRTSNNLESGDCMSVQVSNNGGGSFTTLQTFCGISTNATYDYDISSFIASNTRIRFVVNSTTGSQEYFYIDNVRIADGGPPTPGHWELRVDMGTDDDLNGFAVRAHDGDPGSGGTELNVYAHTFVEFGVSSATYGASVGYTLYPYITSGCFFNSRDFDFDECGSFSYTSRIGAFTFNNPAVSGETGWLNTQVGNNPPLASWVTDTWSADYGIWSAAININNSCPTSDPSNYGTYYLGAFDAEATPPDDQPEENSFRLYLPTDSGTPPVKPFLTQTLSHISGQNPPGVGQTERVAVQTTMFNPTLYPITFSASNLVVANVPGGGAVYAGNATVSQGSITGQPGIGGTGNITWDPGTVAAGTYASLLYYVDVTPASSGQRVSVTGSGASGTRATYIDETCSGASPACAGIQLQRATYTWTYGHAYSGPSFGPLCPLVVTEGGNPIPTRVVISSFDAYEENGHLVVEWKTASEENTVGFYLLRKDRESGEYRQINKNLLPGLINSRQGGTYRLVDEGASLSEGATYKLVEVESRGRQRTYGPFAVGADVKPDLFKSLHKENSAAPHTPEVLSKGEVSHYKREAHGVSKAQEHRLKARQASQHASKAVKRSRVGEQAKISVTEPGLYYLKASEISAVLGMPEQRVRNMIRQASLSLSNQGQKVAYFTDSSSSGIYFYNQGIDSMYSRKNIYWLSRDRGLEMVHVEGSGPSPVAANGTFDEALHFEEDLMDAPGLFKDPMADYWFWDYVFAGDPYMGSRPFTLLANGVAPGADTASLTINLRGASDSGVSNEHHAIFTLNGTQIGETLWQGTDEDHSVTLWFSQDLLKEGDNTLQVAGSLGPGVPYSIFLINSFDLAYQRLYQAVGNELLFRGDANQVVSVSGFTNSDILVFEVTDSLNPKLIKAVTIDGTAGNYRVSLNPASPEAVYLAISRDAAHGGELWADVSSSLKDKGNSAEYVVITTTGLKDTAASLAAYRKGQGLATMVVDQEDIMDEYNNGIYSPEAIRDFLFYAYKNWKKAPRYVVLAGDGSYDYKNNMGFGDSLIPPMMVLTPDGLFPSDNYFVADENHIPMMALGRFPASTSQELQGMIDKTITYETASGGAWASRILMTADISEQGGPFMAESDQVAAGLPAKFTPVRIYLEQHPVDEARWLLLNELHKGVGLMNYIGHGGLDRFSGSGLLVSEDVSSMTNAGKYPVVTAMTCAVGQFSIPGYPSLAEYLVVKHQGGAVAMWSPTGISIDSEALLLDTKFFTHAFKQGSRVLGDVIMKALQDYAQEGNLPSMMDIYTLLGDPALKMTGY